MKTCSRMRDYWGCSLVTLQQTRSWWLQKPDYWVSEPRDILNGSTLTHKCSFTYPQVSNNIGGFGINLKVVSCNVAFSKGKALP